MFCGISRTKSQLRSRLSASFLKPKSQVRFWATPGADGHPGAGAGAGGSPELRVAFPYYDMHYGAGDGSNFAVRQYREVWVRIHLKNMAPPFVCISYRNPAL
jgi:hypothetical protein